VLVLALQQQVDSFSNKGRGVLVFCVRGRDPIDPPAVTADLLDVDLLTSRLRGRESVIPDGRGLVRRDPAGTGGAPWLAAGSLHGGRTGAAGRMQLHAG
jgi:hypothetical protein